MNLDGANVKSVATPAGTPQMLTQLDQDRASTLSATMRASYTSINRVDVQQAGWSMLKRLVRYSVGHGKLMQKVSEQRYVKAPRVDTDSDHAGCVLIRKNTTCAHLFHGVNLLKAGKWTRSTRSLSVAESEFYAGVKDDLILLGAKCMMVDFGEDVGQCVLGTDSCSTKSIMARRGAGRLRHLHCPMLRLEERVDSGQIRTEK